MDQPETKENKSIKANKSKNPFGNKKGANKGTKF